MLPLGPDPIIHYVLSHLAESGFHDIIIIPGYLGDQIMGYVGDGSKFGVEVTYVVEREGGTFGTAGSRRLAGHLVVGTYARVECDVTSQLHLCESRGCHSGRGGAVAIG